MPEYLTKTTGILGVDSGMTPGINKMLQGMAANSVTPFPVRQELAKQARKKILAGQARDALRRQVNDEVVE